MDVYSAVVSQADIVPLIQNLGNWNTENMWSLSWPIYHYKETKPVDSGQVQGYVIGSITFCDTEMTLPYCFLGYHGPIPVNQQGVRERLL